MTYFIIITNNLKYSKLLLDICVKIFWYLLGIAVFGGEN